MSFMMSTVLASVIHVGTLPCTKHFCSCWAILSWRLLKFFSQYPCTWSGPGAFQFGTFLNCFFTFFTSIWNPSCCCTFFNSSFTSANHSACLLCLPGWSQNYYYYYYYYYTVIHIVTGDNNPLHYTLSSFDLVTVDELTSPIMKCPAELRKTRITHVLKKPSLDSQQLTSCRPVSNLPFLGKLIEKVVSSQVASFVDSNNCTTAVWVLFCP